MTWLPGAFWFAIVGLASTLLTVGLVASLAVGWAVRAVRRVRVWVAVRRRPSWIPAAPQPLKPLPRRLTHDRIETELARIGAEIRDELGPDFARLLGLFADDPHTTDH
jgi:hypothetical protein